MLRMLSEAWTAWSWGAEWYKPTMLCKAANAQTTSGEEGAAMVAGVTDMVTADVTTTGGVMTGVTGTMTGTGTTTGTTGIAAVTTTVTGAEAGAAAAAGAQTAAAGAHLHAALCATAAGAPVRTGVLTAGHPHGMETTMMNAVKTAAQSGATRRTKLLQSVVPLAAVQRQSHAG